MNHLVNYCVMETRALSPPATSDGLLPREITIQSIKHQLFFITEEKYKSKSPLPDLGRCCFLSVPSSIHFSIPLDFLVPFAFNDGEEEIALASLRCNVATLRRRDVEASRR